MDLVCAFYRLHSENSIVWTFITLIYLNLGLMSDSTHLCRKYPLSSWFSLLYCELYKPYNMVDLVKTAFISMFNLEVSFLGVVGAYKIFTDCFPWIILWNYNLVYLTLYIDLCLLLTSLSDGIIFYSLWFMPGLYNCWFCITYL